MSIQELLQIDPNTLVNMPLNELQRLSTIASTEFQQLQVQSARLEEQESAARTALDATQQRLKDEFNVTDEASLTALVEKTAGDLKDAHANLVAAYKPAESTAAAAPTTF